MVSNLPEKQPGSLHPAFGINTLASEPGLFSITRGSALPSSLRVYLHGQVWQTWAPLLSLWAGQKGVCCDLEAIQSNCFGAVPKLTECLETHATRHNFYQFSNQLWVNLCSSALRCVLRLAQYKLPTQATLGPSWALISGLWKGRVGFPTPSSGLCGQYFASICSFTFLCLLDGWSVWPKLASAVVKAESPPDTQGSWIVPTSFFSSKQLWNYSLLDACS